MFYNINRIVSFIRDNKLHRLNNFLLWLFLKKYNRYLKYNYSVHSTNLIITKNLILKSNNYYFF